MAHRLITNALRILLVLRIALDVRLACWLLAYPPAEGPEPPSPGEWHFVSGLLIGLSAAFLFLSWVGRSCAIAHELSPNRLRFTPGWAVAWYFLPPFCLWKPCQCMLEIWRESQHGLPRTRGTGLVTSWWMVWILGLVFVCLPVVVALGMNIVAVVSPERFHDMVNDLLHSETFAQTYALGMVTADMALCILSVALVSRVHEMQVAERREEGPSGVGRQDRAPMP